MKSSLCTALASAFIGAIAVLSLQACSQDSGGHAQHQPPAVGASASEQLHTIMMRPMGDMKMSGNVDKDFAKLMIPHHQGAIDMAKIEIEHGKNEELKVMAKAIMDSQAREIEILKKHLD